MINYGDVCCTRAWEVLDDRFAYAGMSPALRFFFTGAVTTMWHNSFSNFHESSTPKSFLIVNNLIGIYLISPAWSNDWSGICITKKSTFHWTWLTHSYFGCWRCQLNATYIPSHSHSQSHRVPFVSSLVPSKKFFALLKFFNVQSRLGTPGLCNRPWRTGSGDQERFTERPRHIPVVSKSLSENYSLKQCTGEDDLRFDRIIRSPEEPYEGFPLDDEEKEKDRFIRILRQVAKKNLVGWNPWTCWRWLPSHSLIIFPAETKGLWGTWNCNSIVRSGRIQDSSGSYVKIQIQNQDSRGSYVKIRIPNRRFREFFDKIPI